MASKKKKDQKKKKKSKGGKKDDWSHEGGVTIEDAYIGNENDETRKKRIHTQEKDERLRRSRRKHEDKRLKTQFAKKMAHKVKFSDILASATQTEAAARETNEKVEEKVVRKPNPPNSNHLATTDRLQMLISRKRPRSDSATDDEDHGSAETEQYEEDIDSDDNIDEERETDDDTDDHESGEAESENLLDENDSSEMKLVFGGDVKSQKVKDHDVGNDADNESDDEHEKQNKTSSSSPLITHYEWFFKSSSSTDQGSGKNSLIGMDKKSKANTVVSKGKENEKKVKPNLIKNISINDVDCGLYAALVSEVSAIDHQACNVQDLPGIYKLWKSQSHPLLLNDFSKQLLPYLSTYSDAFIEGRDHINDRVMAECLLMHSLFHVVKARAKVVRHNDKLKKKAKDQKLRTAAVALEEDQSSIPAGNHKSRKGKGKQPDPVPVVNEVEDDEAMRDQGFARPRLLILCPFRATAKVIVKSMLRIFGENTSISGLEKFETEFADPEESDDEGRGTEKKTKRPDDWEALFNGNMDDDFKVRLLNVILVLFSN